MTSSLTERCAAALASAFFGFAGSVAACPVTVLDSTQDIGFADARLFSPVMQLSSTERRPPAPMQRMQGVPCTNGLANGYPCRNVDLLAYMPLGELGGGSGNDIWGWADPLSGREFALFARTGGTSFVEVTDAVNPLLIGDLPTHSGNSTWRDVKVYDDHAFIVSEASSHGMQVFDLRQLLSVTSPPVTFAETAHYGMFSNAHNIVINEESGYAYAVGTNQCSGGLHMIDISNPTQPAFAGCYSGDGYTHDAQCVIFRGDDHSFHHGSELCFNSNEDTVTIVDVSDKSAPVQIARVPYSNSGYTHQGWLTEDHNYFLLDDELDETSSGHNTRTYIWDVSDPSSPIMTGQFTNSTASIDHNLYVRGAYAFQANYRAGLRILDIASVQTGVLKENGFFDIYPSDDSANFNGAWSNYPYLPSGNVLISGIEQGLFVVKPTALQAAFSVEADDERLAVCGAGSANTNLQLQNDGFYQGTVGLNVSGAPAGSFATVSPQNVTLPGNAQLAIDVTSPLAGQHVLTVEADDGALAFSTSVALEISLTTPGDSEAMLPSDGDGDISGLQTLYWAAADGAFRYDLQVAGDAQFTDLVIDATGLTATSYAPSSLPSGVTLYWRVIAHNACGSTISPTWSFQTAPIQCETQMAVDTPRVISSSGTPSITSRLDSTLGGRIVDVNVVELRGKHSYFSDLDFQLEGPLYGTNGYSRHSQRALVQIMERTCGSQNDFDLNLDDEAAAGAWPCPPVGAGTWQPTNPLSTFNSSSGSGEWNLIVTDNVNQDGGSLDDWGLQICVTSDPEVLDSDGDGVADSQDNCTAVANPDQRDTHGDGYGNACDPDLNNDGTVNFEDLDLLKADFFESGSTLDADLNGDGEVNFADLSVMKGMFFGPPGPSGVAME